MLTEIENISSRWEDCWKADLAIFMLLEGSNNVEEAREKVIRYLEGLEWTYRRDVTQIASWDYIVLKEAVRCMKNIISPRNERLAQCSSLEFLWKASKTGDAAVDNGFIQEFYHLFNAINGKAQIYPPLYLDKISIPSFEGLYGHEASVKRSNYLDELSKSINTHLKKYASGFNEKIINERIKHKIRILDVLGGTEDDWMDWRWQFKNVFKDMEHIPLLKELIELRPEEEEAIVLSLENNVPFGITPHYLHLMDEVPSNNDIAVRRQVIPPVSYVKKMIEVGDDRSVLDFMRESDTSPVSLVTRRYPKVAIIKPYDSCPQICVYCQRNWEITCPFMPGAMADEQTLDNALKWFKDHPEIMDVLITGGDPLVMSDERVKYVIEALTQLPHMISVRIATRIPVTVPMRITKDLCKIFADNQEAGKRFLSMVIHVEHPYEITYHMAEALKMVKDSGLHIYNQQVFTFYNSRRFETVALRIKLKEIGIDPYYLFNMKGKDEIIDYSVPLARVLQERKEEARLLPGIFRADEPVFNVPFLGKNHLRAWQDHELISILPDGRRMYSFHPWEKNLAKVKPYLYTDVSIQSYIDKLIEAGEDPQDYRSIWYYF
ncbi:MAG: KamA family radical SAM protein [Candidatus Hodarchaeales archaeon]